MLFFVIIVSRSCIGPDQVHHAEPLLPAEGREGLAEVREGQDAQG
jgi:hypothetical protein